MLIGKLWFRGLTVVTAYKQMHCHLLSPFYFKHNWRLSTDFSKTSCILFHKITLNDTRIVTCGRTYRHSVVNVHIYFSFNFRPNAANKQRVFEERQPQCTWPSLRWNPDCLSLWEVFVVPAWMLNNEGCAGSSPSSPILFTLVFTRDHCLLRT